MAIGIATVNLGPHAAPARESGRGLKLLLALEAWLDARASRRALYRMDDHALADIGLSRADVEGVNSDPHQGFGQLLLLPGAGQERV